MTTPLSEQAAEYAADAAAAARGITPLETMLQRAAMFGALCALEQIIQSVVAKHAKNEARRWPDWRTVDPDKAIEHIREPA